MQLGRELAKAKAKKSGQVLTAIIIHSGRLYWDRLQILVAVMRAGKSKDKRQNVEIKPYCSQ